MACRFSFHGDGGRRGVAALSNATLQAVRPRVFLRRLPEKDQGAAFPLLAWCGAFLLSRRCSSFLCAAGAAAVVQGCVPARSKNLNPTCALVHHARFSLSQLSPPASVCSRLLNHLREVHALVCIRSENQECQ